MDPRKLVVLAEPRRQAGGRSRHPQQRHPRVAVLGTVPAQQRRIQRIARVLGAGMGVHVHQAR